MEEARAALDSDDDFYATDHDQPPFPTNDDLSSNFINLTISADDSTTRQSSSTHVPIGAGLLAGPSRTVPTVANVLATRASHNVVPLATVFLAEPSHVQVDPFLADHIPGPPLAVPMAIEPVLGSSRIASTASVPMLRVRSEALNSAEDSSVDPHAFHQSLNVCKRLSFVSF